MSKPRTQININIDVYKFLKDKWVWIIGGIIFLIIAFMIPEPNTDIEFLDTILGSANLLFSSLGIILVLVGVIWWIYDNWEAIKEKFY